MHLVGATSFKKKQEGPGEHVAAVSSPPIGQRDPHFLAFPSDLVAQSRFLSQIPHEFVLLEALGVEPGYYQAGLPWFHLILFKVRFDDMPLWFVRKHVLPLSEISRNPSVAPARIGSWKKTRLHKHLQCCVSQAYADFEYEMSPD